MLALCRARGWPTQGYRLPRASGPAGLPRGARGGGRGGARGGREDRRLRRSSRSPSRSSGWRTPSRASRRCPAATRVAAAMRARPDLVGGPDGADYLLMRGGAGLAREGRRGGAAVRGRPGRDRRRAQERRTGRAAPTALRSRLSSAGSASTCRSSRDVPVLNTRGERVGEIVTASLTSSLRIAERVTSIRLGD